MEKAKFNGRKALVTEFIKFEYNAHQSTISVL